MSRAYRFLGWGYVAACAGIVFLLAQHPPEIVAAVPAVPVRSPVRVLPAPLPASSGSDAAQWFRQAKPYCNAVEISVLQRNAPPPATPEGSGYHAACFALAGRIDDARRIIDSLPEGLRRTAAYIVFDIGHPVADAGDDRSAGPIMELVVDYLPDHYMALYHAGMAEYMLGQRDLARRNIGAFLELYKQNDGWRSNGLDVLSRLSDSTHVEMDPRRPREPGT